MLTKRDITQLKDIFVTKEQFNLEMGSVRSDINNLRSDFDSFRIGVFSSFDAIMDELKLIRKELAVSSYRRLENSDLLLDHEKRIKALESRNKPIPN